MTQARIDQLVHDLNSPLQVVKTNGEMLDMRGAWTEEELVQIGRDLVRAGEDIHRIVRALALEFGVG